MQKQTLEIVELLEGMRNDKMLVPISDEELTAVKAMPKRERRKWCDAKVRERRNKAKAQRKARRANRK